MVAPYVYPSKRGVVIPSLPRGKRQLDIACSLHLTNTEHSLQTPSSASECDMGHMLSPSLTCPSFVLLIIFSPTHLFSPGTDRLINGLSLPLSLTPSTFIPINYIQQGSLLCAQPARPPPSLLDLIASLPEHEDADKITAVAAPTSTAHYHP